MCDIVFVAVPTPTTINGFDDSILIDAIKENTYPGQSIVIKSTIKIGTTQKIQDLFRDRFVFHSPEFLREITAEYDVAHPDRNIIGYPKLKGISDSIFIEKAWEIMKLFSPALMQEVVEAEEAEIVKYAGNCFLYTKVVYMNLLYDLCKKENINFNIVKDLLSGDSRIGRSHMEIDHNGRGAGGDCFIKDFAAFKEMYKNTENLIGLDLLTEIEEYNIELLLSSNKNLDLLESVYGIKK